MRRDCEPDRAWILGPMGTASAVCAGLSLFPCFLPLGLVAVPLGFATWRMAGRDLAKMYAGLMGRYREGETRLAQDRAVAGLWIALFSAALWGGLVFLAVAF